MALGLRFGAGATTSSAGTGAPAAQALATGLRFLSSKHPQAHYIGSTSLYMYPVVTAVQTVEPIQGSSVVNSLSGRSVNGLLPRQEANRLT